MNKNFNDKKFKKEVDKQLRIVFSNGMSQGTKAICGVVLEEINSTEKTAEEKLQVLKVFCEKSLGLNAEVKG